jgi:neutral trehalase
VEFIRKVYQPLVNWHEWWKKGRDLDNNGLYEYHWRNESGWDDSPRWDKMTRMSGRIEEMYAEAVDLNCLLYLDAVNLSKMASWLGMKEEAERWMSEAQSLAERINAVLWDENIGLYMDRDALSGKMSKVKSPAAFYTMLVGIAPKSRVERMIREHLLNPKEFWLPRPVPVVAADEETFRPDSFWRGTVWGNIDFIVVSGLRNYGYNELAEEVKSKFIDTITSERYFHERYNPLTGKGIGATNFGWNASLFFQFLLGADKEMFETYPELFKNLK